MRATRPRRASRRKTTGEPSRPSHRRATPNSSAPHHRSRAKRLSPRRRTRAPRPGVRAAAAEPRTTHGRAAEGERPRRARRTAAPQQPGRARRTAGQRPGTLRLTPDSSSSRPMKPAGETRCSTHRGRDHPCRRSGRHACRDRWSRRRGKDDLRDEFGAALEPSGRQASSCVRRRLPQSARLALPAGPRIAGRVLPRLVYDYERCAATCWRPLGPTAYAVSGDAPSTSTPTSRSTLRKKRRPLSRSSFSTASSCIATSWAESGLLRPSRRGIRRVRRSLCR
jgi:hypothetical protein